jgi:hypothetical protein
MTRIYAVRPVEERFWSHVDRSGGPDTCWPWVGNRIWSGYGQFREGGRGSRMVGAHRFSLGLKLGRPLTASEMACHTCDNHACVNPAHLFLGDQVANMADMAAKGRAATGERNASRLHPERLPRGESHGRAIVTEATVQEIRRRAGAGEIQAQLAREFRVSVSLVSRIVRRQTWSHVR